LKRVLIVAIVLAAALALRYGWIEPAAIGYTCDGGQGPWWCMIRRALVLSFTSNGLGYASLILGVLALASHRSGIALTAVCLGVSGLVLYCYEFSAVGLILGVLSLARGKAPCVELGQPDRGGEQQA
jgi:hypothetical protein